MKIEKLKSGSYRIRKMYKGVTYSVVTDYKPTQREAIKLMDQEMDKIQNVKTRITFEEAANRYIESRNKIVSPSTIRGYRSIIKNLSIGFKSMLLSDINNIEVQKEINDYSVGRSPKTVSNANGLIVAILGFFNPNLIIKTKLPQKIKTEDYIPTDSDIKLLLDESKGTMHYLALVLACYGLRRSEICAIDPKTDLRGNELTISKAKVQTEDNKWIIKDIPKTTESARTIYLPNHVADLIRSSKVVYDGYPNSITDWMYSVEDRLGIPRFGIHKLRHYYASISHYLGIPDSYIMKAGGWKTDHVLKSVYRHSLEDKENDLLKVSADYIAKNFIL